MKNYNHLKIPAFAKATDGQGKKRKEYNHAKIERRWQGEWQKKKIYQAQNPSAKATLKKKFYGLMEFPYPSGDGLHVGHVRGYTAMDIISRQKRMEGYNTLFPIGWDAFGLPTENYAIKTGKQPKLITQKNTDNFKKQFNSLGMSFDWSREINTTDPAYYKWTQWIFLQFFKKGLAYKAKVEINWCATCKIGLANEEVVNNLCERCGSEVIKKEKEQWMLAITKYAERLDKDLDLVDFPDRVKSSQRNWIGKSEGSEIEFKIKTIGEKDKIVFLHGRNGSSKNYFYPWLKKELEKTGAKVFFPDLPNTNEPNDEEQADYVIKNILIDENTTIMTHSFGGIVAMRILERGIKIKGLIQFSTPLSGKFLDGKIRKSVTEAAQKGFDFEKIKKQANYFKVVFDSTDNIVPQKDQESLAKKLNIFPQAINAKEAHFCGKEEPEMLDVILPKIKVFTTRADTLFGATYVVLAPEHPLLLSKTVFDNIENKEEVEDYIKKIKSKSDLERTAVDRDTSTGSVQVKTGIELKGIKAINPANNEEVPIWIADYVLLHYGTGAVMAVPAHDERDFEFAQKYNLPIKQVIENNILEKAFTDDGILINSGKFDGMNSEEAIKKITEFVGGKRVTKFKLRDWVFSRQRYWGEPIPLVFCKHCAEQVESRKLKVESEGEKLNPGWFPVKEKDLPLKLPEVKNYKPTNNGESPLANISKWVNVKCPKCKGKARRETDTMPNWAGSSWYYLRYTDPKNKKVFADQKKLKYWLGSPKQSEGGMSGVDHYNGGMEHTTLHLLYSRFWHKFLYDLKLVPTAEPYAKRTSHGMILAEGGVKMSKSKGNVINPDEIVKIYGADTLRIYEMFVGPFEDTAVWNTESIIGSRRFIEKVWRIGQNITDSQKNFSGPRISSRQALGQTIQNSSDYLSVQKLLHKTIKKVTEDIANMRFNTAISAMMILATEIEKIQGKTLDITKGLAFSVNDFKKFLQILAPFAPHITEELWFCLGEKKSISLSFWPKWDDNLIKDTEIKLVIQVNGKVRDEMRIAVDENENEIKEKAQKTESVLKFIEGKEIKKIIYVKNRLINIVV
jgi:leucyl-tRNA synthetase